MSLISGDVINIIHQWKRLKYQKLRNMFFRLITRVGQRKILSRHEESNLRPSDLRTDVLPLSHNDSSVSGVYYEVLMTRVLHTSRISNVDNVIFFDRNNRDGKFWARWRIKKDVFSSCHERGRKKERIPGPNEREATFLHNVSPSGRKGRLR